VTVCPNASPFYFKDGAIMKKVLPLFLLSMTVPVASLLNGNLFAENETAEKTVGKTEQKNQESESSANPAPAENEGEPQEAPKGCPVDSVDPTSARIKEASKFASARGEMAEAEAVRAANGSLVAEAVDAASKAKVAEFEARIKADIAFKADSANAAEAAKDASEKAEKAMEAAKKAIDASAAAGKLLAEEQAAKEAAERSLTISKELYPLINLELQIAGDQLRPVNERVSALEVLTSIALEHSDLGIPSTENDSLTIQTTSSYIVIQISSLSNNPTVFSSSLSSLGQILASSGNDVALGTNEKPLVFGSHSDKSAYEIAVGAMVSAAGNSDVRIQRASSSALTEALAGFVIDEGEYLDREFQDIVSSIRMLIQTHPSNQVKLGLLTALAKKGDHILKQEIDVADAAGALAKTQQLKQKYDAAVESLQQASSSGASTKLAVTSFEGALSALDSKINEKIAEIALAKGEGSGSEVQFENELKELESARAGQVKVVEEARKKDDTAKSELTRSQGAEKSAKSAYESAKAESDAKSKVKPVAGSALPTVLFALRELSSSTMPVDRVRVEARYALTKFLKSELLPGDEALKFTPGPMPTDRQPLAASDRPTAGMMNSERIGVTLTRSFNPALDVTNRPTRGPRVAAPPQSLRIPGPDAVFSSKPPEVLKAAGATPVKVPAFVPGTLPKAATPAAPIK
jgi:hypothetical protein